jgi:RHH-type rel operon transcriptional repressor/antitoxin RelB
MLTLELPEDVERRLDLLAARTGKPTSFYAVTALRDLLDSEEDFLIAAERLANKQPGIRLEDVEARLGLES